MTPLKGVTVTQGDDIRVSIIMPMLNEERFIGACLDSVLSQTFDMNRVEILVVDGGSTDRSREIVSEYAAKNPRIRLLKNPYRYQAQALNLAVPHSRGTIVLRMDCHSTYVPDYIEQVVAAFERSDADNVQGPNITRPGAETTAAMAIFHVQGSRLAGGASYGRQEGGEGRFLGPTDNSSGWSFTRAAIDRFGPFDERLIRNQDNEYTSRLRRMGGRAWFEPQAKSYYYARSRIPVFARLMYRNGFYHMLTWRVSPGSFAITHCIPAGFVATITLLGVLSAGFGWARWALAGVLGLYGVVVGAESLRIAAKNGWRFLLWTPWLIPLTHVSYGVGTILGMLRHGLTPIDRSPAGRRVDTRDSVAESGD